MKNWYSSLTIRGGGIAIAAGITLLAKMAGIEVIPEDAEALANGFLGLLSTVGGILAILGRIRANKQIGSV
jgi:sugar phosphate permease